MTKRGRKPKQETKVNPQVPEQKEEIKEKVDNDINEESNNSDIIIKKEEFAKQANKIKNMINRKNIGRCDRCGSNIFEYLDKTQICGNELCVKGKKRKKVL